MFRAARIQIVSADDLRVAVRRAGMIDVARDVAAHGGIADVESVQLEAPDVAFLQVPRLALEALAVGDLLASVVNDPCVLGDRPGREHAPALNRRTPLFDHWRNGRLSRLDDRQPSGLPTTRTTSPVPHPAGVDVHEVGRGIEADAADLQRLGGVAEVLAAGCPARGCRSPCPRCAGCAMPHRCAIPPRSCSIALVSGVR